MAAWWEALPKLGIFAKCLQSGPKEALSLLCSSDSHVFFWSEEDGGICTFNVRRFHTEISSADSVAEEISAGQLKRQLLRCNRELSFRVERVSASPDGEAVLLFGRAGLAVVKLHKRRGPHGEYGGGHESVICPTFIIDLYSTSGNIVMKIDWLDDVTFVVLSTDNILRKFSLELPTHPVLSVGLSETSQPFPSASAPGMDWVDFSILSPTTIALLQDSGDIHLLTVGGPEEVALSEPLPMYPSAQDNYTSDATAVLALPTSLPVIIIATPSGEIHHCILLPRTQSSGGAAECLFVFERLSLEADLIEDFGSVELLPDPTSCSSYFIKHAVGIHRMVLPWADFLNNYVSNEEFAVDVCQLQGHAEVHFIVDVESSDQSNSAAVCGVAVVCDSCINSGLVCVASDGTCIVHLLPTLSAYFATAHSEQEKEEEEEVEEGEEGESRHISPSKGASSEFPRKIASLLAHDSSRPIFHVDTTKEKSQEESLKILTASTQHLTNEYLAKQEMALVEMNQKIKLLVQFRQQQLSDLQDVRDRVDVEVQQERRVEQKLRRAEKKGDELLERLKQAVCFLSFQSPGLSNEEQKLRKKLLDMQVNLEKLTTRMGLLKGKCKTVGYDLDQPVEVPTLTETQLEYTRSILKEQMTDIADLVTHAKAMQACLAVKMEDTALSLQQQQEEQQ